jgi:membrane-bound serine protease (ClpP class)
MTNKWMWFIGLLLSLLSAPSLAAEKVLLIDWNGAISPAAEDFINQGINKAEEMKATALILRLNSADGMENSMRGINDAILASSVPVITFIAPSDANVSGAGTYVVYASHFAAMAQNTHIGAATPIRITSQEKHDPKLLDHHEKKTLQDASHYLQSLAELRGRNSTWVTLSVAKNISISADEALKLHVINAVAQDVPQLLIAADGKKVKMPSGIVVMQTKNAEVVTMTPSLRTNFLSIITDPSVAYLLLLAALYGIFLEVSSPGLFFPGVIGIIALFLSLYAFDFMPVNYAGMSLLLIGVTFMLLEIFVSTFGIIGLGGVIAFVMGSVLLYDTDYPGFHIGSTLILAMATLTAAFFFMLIILKMKSHKKISNKDN